MRTNDTAWLSVVSVLPGRRGPYRFYGGLDVTMGWLAETLPKCYAVVVADMLMTGSDRWAIRLDDLIIDEVDTIR